LGIYFISKVSRDFDNLYYPVECFCVAIHSYFDTFTLLHISRYIGKVRDSIRILDPFSRQQDFFSCVILPVFIGDQDLDVVEIEFFTFFLWQDVTTLLSTSWSQIACG